MGALQGGFAGHFYFVYSIRWYYVLLLALAVMEGVQTGNCVHRITYPWDQKYLS